MILIYGAGLSGSYIVRQKFSPPKAARDDHTPARALGVQARYSRMYKSLYNLSDEDFETMRSDDPDPRLDVIKTAVDEQIQSLGQDALEDWRDIIEDDA